MFFFYVDTWRILYSWYRKINQNVCFDYFVIIFLEPKHIFLRTILLFYRFYILFYILIKIYRYFILEILIILFWDTFVLTYYLVDNYFNPSLFLCIYYDNLKPFLYVNKFNCYYLFSCYFWFIYYIVCLSADSLIGVPL